MNFIRPRSVNFYKRQPLYSVQLRFEKLVQLWLVEKYVPQGCQYLIVNLGWFSVMPFNVRVFIEVGILKNVSPATNLVLKTNLSAYEITLSERSTNDAAQ